ncbi:hypothetical protein AYL99_09226 [Fonsecaea erecta]|uniref:aldehyde dehydrogenase (NAD(+)) n=1 Tax=Fonsecaea erecta TaxID=1367422 RepID=A0A178ZD66_9EURO|nr:hypothetical protein AYL99_09226 [Fonsecaea erecta]OAP57113.1 hypothetical protein AYL99_09226 [Fonsecaea erecta]
MPDLLHTSNWINGAHTPPSAERIHIVNPATEATIGTVDTTSREAVDTIISDSLLIFRHGKWSRSDASERYSVLFKAAVLLRSRIPEFVELETSDLSYNEVFGPVITLIKCESEDEVIRIANNSPFTLGASVWTNDFAQAHRMAEKIDADIVWINRHHLNDLSSPWGGFKESGMGKENGIEAYESYTKVKSTVINYGVPPAWFDDEIENARYG